MVAFVVSDGLIGRAMLCDCNGTQRAHVVATVVAMGVNHPKKYLTKVRCIPEYYWFMIER